MRTWENFILTLSTLWVLFFLAADPEDQRRLLQILILFKSIRHFRTLKFSFARQAGCCCRGSQLEVYYSLSRRIMSRLGHCFCSTGWSGGLNMPGCKTPAKVFRGCKTPAKIFRGRLTPSNCPSDPQNETQHTDDAIQCARLIYLAWV